MQAWVTLETHTVFEKESECFVAAENFNVKLNLAVGKKRSTADLLLLTMVKWVTET